MENIKICTKYILNVNESIISNNMKLFCLALDKALTTYDSDGFVILDNNFKIPHHALIYNFAKSVLDKKKISIDDYKIILRASSKTGKQYYDLCLGYGEYHEIQKSNDITTVEPIGDFHMYVNFNNCDDILTLSTDLNKTILDDEPNMNEINIFRPPAFSSLTTHHMGTYYLKEVKETDINIDNLLKNGLFKVSLEFVNKNSDFECLFDYPNFSDIFENEAELYDVYETIYPFSINKNLFVTDIKNTSINDIRCISDKITEEVVSVSDNFDFKEILEKYDYTFEKLYKSLFPGEYCCENFIIEHYPSVYNDDSTTPDSCINMKSTNYKCCGPVTVPSDTNKIIKEINEYMKIHNIKYIKIII